MRIAWLALLAGCGFQSQFTATAEDAMPAPEMDADIRFSPCPPTYVAPLPGPSRYRLISEGHRAWEQHDACAKDLPGSTHLAVIETATELAALASFAAAPGIGIAHNNLWLGAVQLPTANANDAAWIGFDGAPLLASPWAASEPNDGGGGGDADGRHREQFISIERGKLALRDAPGDENNAALCECDGVPIAAEPSAAIEAYRPGS